MPVIVKQLTYVVCDSCLEVVAEEGGEWVDRDDEDMLAELARTLGGEICDHLCDTREGDIAATCVCACNPRRGGMNGN